MLITYLFGAPGMYYEHAFATIVFSIVIMLISCSIIDITKRQVYIMFAAYALTFVFGVYTVYLAVIVAYLLVLYVLADAVEVWWVEKVLEFGDY